MLAEGRMKIIQFIFSLMLVIVHFVVLVLHMMHIFRVLVLKILVSRQEFALELLIPVVPFLFNGLVRLMVLFDVVIALVMQIMQLALELVDGVLDFMDLLRDRASRMVPELVLIHPIVMIVESLSAEWALNDTIVFMVRNVILYVIVLTLAAQAQIDDLDRMVVHEDVHVENETAELH